VIETPGPPGIYNTDTAPTALHSFSGGFFVVFYVLATITIAPKIGLGNAIFLVLMGQIVSISVVDHYGLFGSIQVPISFQKTVGITFMVIGIFLARRIV